MRGVAMLGAISRLQSSGMLDGMRTVVGTSAGALLAAVVATKRDLKGSLDIMCAHGYVPDFDFGRLLKEFGLDSGKSIDSLVDALLGPANLTFGDVQKLHGVRLVVCATNLTTRRAEFFCAATHPDMPIALAVRMSCSVPLYFRAVKYRGNLYVDGSVTNNFACDWALRNGCERVLGVTLKARGTSIKTLDNFLGALVEASAFATQAPSTAIHILELDAPGTSAFDFGAPKSQLALLFASGVHEAETYLKKHA